MNVDVQCYPKKPPTEILPFSHDHSSRLSSNSAGVVENESLKDSSSSTTATTEELQDASSHIFYKTSFQTNNTPLFSKSIGPTDSKNALSKSPSQSSSAICRENGAKRTPRCSSIHDNTDNTTRSKSNNKHLEVQSRHMEEKHVHQVYSKIAPRFGDVKQERWPKVDNFLKSLAPNSFVADVGCGNGRFLDLNSSIMTFGSDICPEFVDQAKGQGQQIIVADNIQLPYRDAMFDAVISIGVIHHFASTARRVQVIQEIARVITPGGKVMIYVWAFEQIHRKFTHQDVLIPWKRPDRNGCFRSSVSSSLDDEKQYQSLESSPDEEETRHYNNTPSQTFKSQSKLPSSPATIQSSHSAQYSHHQYSRRHSSKTSRRDSTKAQTTRVFGVYDRRDSSKLRGKLNFSQGDSSALKKAYSWKFTSPATMWTRKRIRQGRSQSLDVTPGQDDKMLKKFQTQLVFECQKVVNIFKGFSVKDDTTDSLEENTPINSSRGQDGDDNIMMVNRLENSDTFNSNSSSSKGPDKRSDHDQESSPLGHGHGTSSQQQQQQQQSRSTASPVKKISDTFTVETVSPDARLPSPNENPPKIIELDDDAVSILLSSSNLKDSPKDQRRNNTERFYDNSAIEPKFSKSTTKSESNLIEHLSYLDIIDDWSHGRKCCSFYQLSDTLKPSSLLPPAFTKEPKATTISQSRSDPSFRFCPSSEEDDEVALCNNSTSHNTQTTTNNYRENPLKTRVLSLGKYFNKAKFQINILDKKKKQESTKLAVEQTTKYQKSPKTSKRSLPNLFTSNTVRERYRRLSNVLSRRKSQPYSCGAGKSNNKCVSPNDEDTSRYGPEPATTATTTNDCSSSATLPANRSTPNKKTQIENPASNNYKHPPKMTFSVRTTCPPASTTSTSSDSGEDDETDVFLPEHSSNSSTNVKRGEKTTVLEMIKAKLNNALRSKNNNSNSSSCSPRLKETSFPHRKEVALDKDEMASVENSFSVSKAKKTLRNTFFRDTTNPETKETLEESFNRFNRVESPESSSVSLLNTNSNNSSRNNHCGSKIMKRPNYLDFSKKRPKPRSPLYNNFPSRKKSERCEYISLDDAMTLLGNGWPQERVVSQLDAAAQVVFSEMKRLNFSIRNFPMSSMDSGDEKTLLLSPTHDDLTKDRDRCIDQNGINDRKEKQNSAIAAVQPISEKDHRRCTISDCGKSKLQRKVEMVAAGSEKEQLPLLDTTTNLENVGKGGGSELNDSSDNEKLNVSRSKYYADKNKARYDGEKKSINNSMIDDKSADSFNQVVLQQAKTTQNDNNIRKFRSSDDETSFKSNGNNSVENSVVRDAENETIAASALSTNDDNLRRYYHVFKKNELDDLIRESVPSLQIVDAFYDHANWCVVAQKL